MTLNLDEVYEGFLLDFARFEKLARHLETVLTSEVPKAGVVAVIQVRAKEWPNFARKAIKKYAEDQDKHGDPLRSVRDRAGARLLVPTLADAHRAAGLLEELFEAQEPLEDARDRLDVHELGYLGMHFQGRVRVNGLGADKLDLEGLDFEVQIHTYAQHGWSEVSHKLLYKPAGRPPPAALQRRITRAIALAELFDDEIEGARAEIMNSPDHRPAAMLEVLQGHFLQLVRKDFNADLSLEVLRVLEGAYKVEDLDRFDTLIEQFVAGRREELRLIFTNYAEDPRVAPILFQPEALAIFERAVNAPSALQQAWYQAATLPELIFVRLSEVIAA